MTEDFNIFSTMIHVSRRGRKTLKYHVSFSYRTCGLVIIDYNLQQTNCLMQHALPQKLNILLIT